MTQLLKTPSTSDASNKPIVTIVMMQRDRLSLSSQCLDSLYETADVPFRLIYVTGGAPKKFREWLDGQAMRRGFEHVAHDRFLSPNEARNLGVKMSRTPYVFLAENDVMYKKGWLSELVKCAEETGADVVNPLTCQGFPLHEEIHFFDGSFYDPETFFKTPMGQRDFQEHIGLQGKKVTEVADQLVRKQTGFLEFHGVLVRKSIMEKVGPLDTEVISIKEYLDFCLMVLNAGGKIWSEPKSVVTFIYPHGQYPVRLIDWPYFMLRWSKNWEERSIRRIQEKWGLRSSGFIAHRRTLMDWRLPEGVLKPALKKIPLLGGRWGFRTRMASFLYPAAQFFASMLAKKYERDRLAASRKLQKTDLI
ncbi:glycosyltransferase family 2 protein [Hirschia litorea]|uniref:Glycosyltransferase family 2 protein n=1 Tax=Hirschia litorea TaxID=1199156 RepID=A0ABW2IP96_9PROT